MMLISIRHCVLILLVIFVMEAKCGKRISKDHYDALIVASCEAKCYYLQKPEKNECITLCLISLTKPGRCALPSEMTMWESPCIKACKRDIHCPGMTKCCQHECGATCHEPRDLQEVSGLPNIPQNINVTESRRGRSVKVSWTLPDVNALSPVMYVLEERHHIGRHFIESRLDQWTPRQRSQKPFIFLKNLVKPGRWYQFRVAAVNQNGTRGFSLPSCNFQISRGPRSPSVPQELEVSNLRLINGSLRGRLEWKPPSNADLPIHKYKVFWSLRLQSHDQNFDSVIVHHHTVGRDQTHFDLKDLKPNSLYFVQVQALVQFGAKKLKSEKAAMFLNTSKYNNDTSAPYDGNGLKRSLEGRIEGLHLLRINWMKDQLVAYIAWKPVQTPNGKQIKYNVQWWTDQHLGSENGNKIKTHASAITDVTKFKIHNMFYGCKYLVRVNKVIDGHNSPHASEITFKTPPCQQIRPSSKGDHVKCHRIFN